MSNLDEKGFVLVAGEITKRICCNVRRNAQFKEYLKENIVPQ